MTAFHKQSWNQRLDTMGDPAEDACDIVHNGRTHPLGLNRVWGNGIKLYLNDMTLAMRYTPDRLTRTAFVECMGIGRDGTLKIKIEKIDALLRWADLGPTDLFVYDSNTDEYWQAPIDDWDEQCAIHGELKSFPEGKEYFALHRNNFPADPQQVPRETDEQAA